MHVGVVIHMLNRGSASLKGVLGCVSDIKTIWSVQDFADALGLHLYVAVFRLDPDPMMNTPF